ncbi:MAG: DUF4340 domain-containing protein, partial [Planctomycetes bacterium]|nr:DUF4340 domain-containing protein [Planctomycetota bacterium]
QSLAEIPVDQIVQVSIRVPGQPELSLKAPEAGKPLELPGNWPIRRYEVDEVLSLLKDLKSRYHPIAISDQTDLKPYGLTNDQKPIVVEITTKDGFKQLLVGQAPLADGENPFTRATFVRVVGKNELLRLGPQVVPILRRDEDTYRRRQLFPEAIRARVADRRPPKKSDKEDPEQLPIPTFVLSDAAKKIVIETPEGRYVLHREAPLPPPTPLTASNDDEQGISPQRIADSWVMAEPYRDRVDPDKIRSILTAIPNLWLEKFVDAPQKSDGSYGLGDHPAIAKQICTLLGGSIPNGIGDTPLRAVLNYAALSEAKSPTARVTVTYENGETRTLQIGSVSRKVGGDDLRFAKIVNNPLVFELKSDKLADLRIDLSPSTTLVPNGLANQLRDPNVLRFDPEQVSGIELVSPRGKSERIIKLEKQGKEWRLVQPLAEAADPKEVAELLNLVKGLDARGDDLISTRPTQPIAIPTNLVKLAPIDPTEYLGLAPGDTRKLTLTFEAGSGRKPVTLVFGKANPPAGKRAAMVDGWNRVNLIDEKIDAGQTSRFDRQPSSFREVKLFDRAQKINEIVVARAATAQHPADSFTILQTSLPPLPPKWMIVAPFKAETDVQIASPLALSLSGIGDLKYVRDPKTDDPLVFEQWPPFLDSLGIKAPAGEAIFGLDPPALTLTLKFADPMKPAEDVVLEIGNPRSPTEYYARRKGNNGIFVVSDRLVKAADHRPEGLVDKALIQLPTEMKVQAIRRTMEGQAFDIVQNNRAEWAISKPTQMNADQQTVEDLATALSQLNALRVQAVAPKDLKEYGLEPPFATIKLEAISDKAKEIEKVLLIGKLVDPSAPKGERFVQVKDSPIVAVLAGPLAERLIAEPRTFRDLSLGNFVKADKITIESRERMITFLKGNKGWRVNEPLDAAAEDEDINDLVAALAKIKAEELVEDKPASLAKYGLDKPTRWRIYDGSKLVLDLLLGDYEKVGPNKTTKGHRLYAKVDKSETVALLDFRLSRQLAQEYRLRSLWEPPIAASRIKEVSIKPADGKDVITLSKNPLGWIDPEKPTERLSAERVGDLVSQIPFLLVDQFVADKGADLAKFGLDKPRLLTITLEDGMKHTLLLGKLSDGKKLYAKAVDPARTDVFLLGESISTALNRPKADYVLKPLDEPKKVDPKKEELKKVEKK